MTLRKKEEDVQPEFDPAEVMRMEKFTEWIKELAVYLGDFKIVDNFGGWPDINSVHEYDNRIVKNDRTSNKYFTYSHSGFNFFCVTGNKGKSSNVYCTKTIENIFPAHNLVSDGRPYSSYFGGVLLPYNCNVEDYGWNGTPLSFFNKTDDTEYRIKVWRDDLHFSKEVSRKYFINVLKSIEHFDNKPYYGTWWVKYYNIFWNLFIVALDEEVYNEQLMNVVELAHYWDFDETMLRDWCRAVEYVMSGKKLSPDCDLECETVEGARFFLHQEE